MAELEARGLVRRFGDHTPVDGVDLDLHAGEMLGLIGPNGGGKSTLLLLFAGLLAPSEGTVTVEGRPTTSLALEAAGAVGLVTAEPGLYPLLTGRENLHFFGGLHGLAPAEVDARAAALAERLDLSHALDRRVGGYSSGMKQKTSLVRALLQTPRILLLDEPTANLDPVASHRIHTAIRHAADEGVAVVLATHDLHAAEHVCDRVGVMNRRLDPVVALEGDRRPPPRGPLLSLLESA